MVNRYSKQDAHLAEEAVHRAGENFGPTPTLYIRVANYGTVKATELKPRKPAEQVCVAI